MVSFVYRYADHNKIVDPTEFGQEAYTGQKGAFVPFETVKALKKLYVLKQ